MASIEKVVTEDGHHHYNLLVDGQPFNIFGAQVKPVIVFE